MHLPPRACRGQLLHDPTTVVSWTPSQAHPPLSAELSAERPRAALLVEYFQRLRDVLLPKSFGSRWGGLLADALGVQRVVVVSTRRVVYLPTRRVVYEPTRRSYAKLLKRLMVHCSFCVVSRIFG